MTPFTRRLASAVVGTVAALHMLGAAAADYPTRPITLIVPWKAGGTTETMSQVLSKAMGDALGGKVIVQTRPGGGGAVGATLVASAKPDGYTIGYSTLASLTFVPLYRPEVKYRTDGFTFIAGVSEYQMALVATPDKPYKTMPELVAHSKANPGLNVADMGGMSKVFVNYIAKQEGVDWTPIPTRGGGEMVPFVLGGKVDFAYSGGIHGKYPNEMVVIASMLNHRQEAYPDAPSVEELYGISMPGNAVMFGPAGMPADVVAKLEGAVKTAMDDPDFTKLLQTIKFPKMYISHADMGPMVQKTVAGLQKVLDAVK